MENEILYGKSFDLSGENAKYFEDPNFVLSIGKAHIELEGTAVTIVAHSISVQWALEAAQVLKEKHGILAEVNASHI